MTPADRRDMWLALAEEAGSLVVDHEASFFVDADHAKLSIDMRLSALRGQTRGLAWSALPFPAWETGKAFLWAAAQFAGDGVTPAQRRERGPDLFEAARQLDQVLSGPEARRRHRADLDG